MINWIIWVDEDFVFSRYTIEWRIGCPFPWGQEFRMRTEIRSALTDHQIWNRGWDNIKANIASIQRYHSPQDYLPLLKKQNKKKRKLTCLLSLEQ